MSGPAPTPTSILSLRGSPLARNRGSEPQPPEGELKPPKWLTATARAKWDELLPVLTATRGLLTLADADTLAWYCHAAGEAIETDSKLRKLKSLTCTGEKGGEYPHPLIGIRNKAIQRMRMFGALLGLSPADRTRIHISPPTGPGVWKRDRNDKGRFFSA